MLRKISDLYKLLDKQEKKKKLALAVAQDKYAIEAVMRAYENGIVDPIFVGDAREINKIGQMQNLDFSNLEIINETEESKAIEISVRLVHDHHADILMKGNCGTASLLRGVLNKEWGLRKGELLSHFALFELKEYHKLLALTDVAINIAPTFKEKVAIVKNSVEFLNHLGLEKPKVAAIGAIEMVNESMQATLDAALLAIMSQRKQIRNCVIDGPLAFDNAISKESALHKNIDSPVAGDADLLFLPDIEVGNVLYKSFVFFAKAKLASCILGATAPIVLTSRSDSEESKMNSILLAAVGQ